MKHARKKSNETKRHMFLLPVFLVAVVAFILGAAAPDLWAHGKKEKVELDDATIIVEVNATDGDAGFQIFLDGEGWRRVSIYDPNWRQIFKVNAKGGVKEIGGGTELFLETAEPEYEDLEELQELLDLLPPGDYRFYGRTVEGDWLYGTAELTHVIPAGPVIIEPALDDEAAVLEDEEDECARVEIDEAEISWDPVTTTIFGLPGIVIVGYQVIVENEDSGNELNITLPAETTSVTVPEEFLEPGMEYKFEILAIEESGNQTITESCFETEEE